MGRPAKKINDKMHIQAEDLKNVHNSDDHHVLYDLYNLFEAKHPDIAAAIQNMIERTFGKHEDLPEGVVAPLREIDFIFEHAHKFAKKEWKMVSFRTGTIIEPRDIAQKAMEKIIVGGNYNQTLLKGEKLKYIKDAVTNARKDLMSDLDTRDKRASELSEFSEAHDPLYKKRLDYVNDDDSSED